jgi:cell division protein FtsI/penicillin-binding protein 2
VDLQDETSVSLRDPKKWADIDLATVSFGQGIAVTPIQILDAVGAIANGGVRMQPHIVSKVVSDNQTFSIQPKPLGQVITPKTAQAVTQMMVAAATHGDAKWALPKGYLIAGKTGTAQVPIGGHYDPTKTVASFVGFAPADHPKFVMLVRLLEPSTSQWGSETAAPLWFSISRDIFLKMGIPPTEISSP